MNILITGGAGYIGSHTANVFLDHGHAVTIIDSLVNGHLTLIPKKAKFLNCDIIDEKKVSSLLEKNKFDVVVHFAGFTRVAESVKDPDKYYDNNFEKPKLFFNYCLKYKLKKIIFSSTGSIYGNIDKKNILETDEACPINPYSESKYKLEEHLIQLSNEKKINATILRYFNVSGADENMRSGLMSNPDNLIKAVCEVATKKRDKLIVNGNNYNTKDGTTIRDFIHVSDLAEMHLIAAKDLVNKSETEIFNCGYGVGYSIQDIINTMNKILKSKINFEYGPRRKGDAEYSVANNEKFVKRFNWKPKHNNLEYILKTALNWEKNI
jgi:UDP-glucose 4-epimerase|tara:strand:+ start:628 stop:1596 length:969 start_codon:yes stop_codon:yes gene_type:complete